MLTRPRPYDTTRVCRQALPEGARLRARSDVNPLAALAALSALGLLMVADSAWAASADVSVTVEESATLDVTVTVSAKRAPTFQVFTLPGAPHRFVVELPGETLSGVPLSSTGSGILLLDAQLEEQRKSAPARVVLAFADDVDYDASTSGGALIVKFAHTGDVRTLLAAAEQRKAERERLRAEKAAAEGRIAAEARARAEAEAARLAEAERKRQDMEAARLAEIERKRVAEEERKLALAKKQLEEDQKKLAVLEAKRKAIEEKKQQDEARKVAAEKKRQELEQARLAAIAEKQKAEAEKLKAEELQKVLLEQKRKEEEQRKLAALDAKRRAEEEARIKAEEAKKAQAEAAARVAAELEAKKLADKKAEEEQKRLAALETQEAKKKAEAEQKRLAALEAKKLAEESARRAVEDAARRKAEEDARRIAELVAQQKRDELARAAALEARRKAEDDARIARIAEEQTRVQQEQQRRVDAQRKLDEQRRQDEEKLALARRAADERRAEEERLRKDSARFAQVTQGEATQGLSHPRQTSQAAPAARDSEPGFGGQGVTGGGGSKSPGLTARATAEVRTRDGFAGPGSIDLTPPARYERFIPSPDEDAGWDDGDSELEEADGKSVLTQVLVQRFGEGSRVGVRVDGGARYNVERRGTELSLTLFDTRPATFDLRRALDARALGTNVVRVVPSVEEDERYRVELIIELRKPAPVKLGQDGGILWLTIGEN